MEGIIIFGGIVVSLLVQALKHTFNTGKYGSMLISVIIAFIGAVIYMVLTHFGFWEIFIKILSAATLFYAFIIKAVEDNPIE